MRDGGNDDDEGLANRNGAIIVEDKCLALVVPSECCEKVLSARTKRRMKKGCGCYLVCNYKRRNDHVNPGLFLGDMQRFKDWR